MIPIKFDGRIKAIGWQHPHPFNILRNGIWFGLDAQTIPTSSNYLLQRRIRPHLVAQQAVNDNISLVGVFVDGHYSRNFPLHPTMLITKPIRFSIARALRALLSSRAAATELPGGFDGCRWWWRRCLLCARSSWVSCGYRII